MKEKDSLKCKTTKSFSEPSISEVIHQAFWAVETERVKSSYRETRQGFSPKGVCATKYLDRSAWRVCVSSDPDSTLERSVNEADSILGEAHMLVRNRPIL